MKSYKEEIEQSHDLIKKFIHRTPVLTSTLLNELTGVNLFFKCDNFQKMGAFKIRGASNALIKLSEDQLKKGVVTHSSGNFAQALSLAARNAKTKAYIVMPSNAPKVKKEAVIGYGAEIIECESTLKARIQTAVEVSEKYEATFIHPSNDINVIIGNASLAKEFLEDYPDLDYLFTPIGGGGLVAGTILAADCFGTNCKVIGAEPFEVDDAFRSLKSGKIESNQTSNTIADGLKTQLGDVNFPIIQYGIDKIIRVTEDEIKTSLKLIWERLKIVVEPSSAVALTALVKEKEYFQGKKVGIVVSGGNVDFKFLQ